jgi:DNA-binding MarR family transcriptional regulator
MLLYTHITASHARGKMTDIIKKIRDGMPAAKIELANRLFFRLYQCANMLHKTGSRAVEREGLTTQQWAVLGALSRKTAEHGMSVGDLARYLMVSRQNLAGLLGRMERDGHITVAQDARDRRSRIVTMTDAGRHVWGVSPSRRSTPTTNRSSRTSRSTMRRICCTISSRSWKTCSASTPRRRASRSRRSRTQPDSLPPRWRRSDKTNILPDARSRRGPTAEPRPRRAARTAGIVQVFGRRQH